MTKTFRAGNIGALMDEYERATVELRRLVESLPESKYTEILDCETADEDCRSVQTIMAHVVGAGYSYADYLRAHLAIDSHRPASERLSKSQTAAALDRMLEYTIETFEGRWIMSEDEINAAVIDTSWGSTYDIEQLFEHAIVHILRHRRQIERLLAAN
jgi:uncharacterized damage-inducible protein DinB